MKKGILCAIDFSDSSKAALRWSIDIARELNHHLTVLYTYRLLRPYHGEVIDMKRKIEDEALKHFADLEKELLIDQGVSYDFKTEVGFVADRAKDHIKNSGVKLLVVGQKMSSSNKQSFDELVADLQMPLVIVP
jgi:nucleotide-binding universal stress UspA family protein